MRPERARRTRRALLAGVLAAGVAAAVGSAAGAAGLHQASAAAGGRTVIWAVGDGADGSAASRRVAARIAASRVDRFLYLGDVYDTGTAGEYARNYAPAYSRLDRITVPTPGNHEWDNRAQGYNAYWHRVTGRTPPQWSSFKLAGWQFLDLNSEAEHGAGSAQLGWLRRHVRGRGNCRIAFWHRPRYSAGTHGDQADVEPFWRQLQGHARIVLNGHDHDMQRFASRRGIVEFVSGAGGHGHYPLHAHGGLRFGNASAFGALRLALRPGHASWAFVTESGRRLDSGRLSCRRR